MGRRKDYIPLKDDDFFTFQMNLVDKVTLNKTAWGIPNSVVTPLTARRTAYEPLYRKSRAKQSRNSIDVIAHRQSRKVYEKELRIFAKAYLMFNPAVSPGDKISMGLTVRDTEPSPRPKISDIPMVGLTPLGGGEIEVTCRRTTDQNRPSIHSDADGIECRFTFAQVGEKPPKSSDDCPRTQVSKKARFVINCGMKNVSQRFYGFFRWVNISNQDNSGSWSDAKATIIA